MQINLVRSFAQLSLQLASYTCQRAA